MIFGERDRSSGLRSQLVPLTAGGEAERCWLRSRCCDAPPISSSGCVQPLHQSVCAAVHTAGPPRWKLSSARRSITYPGITTRVLDLIGIKLRDIHPCSQTQTGGLAGRGECQDHHRELSQHERHSRTSSGHGVLSSWWSAVYVVRELAEHHWFSTPGVETPGVIEQVVQQGLNLH